MKIISQIRNSRQLMSLGGHVIFALSNAVTFLVMARYLDPVVFGEWILFMTVSSLMNMLKIGLIGTGAIRSISIASEQEKGRYIGALYQLGVWVLLFVAIAFFLLFLLLRFTSPFTPYLTVVSFYPLLALVSIPYHQATVVLQGEQRFDSLFFLKSLHGFVQLVLILSYLFMGGETLVHLLMLYILVHFVLSLVSVFLKLDGMALYRSGSAQAVRELLTFGKYSSLISVGSSLLRSADTFILSFSIVMGPTAIAVYAIPMKFVEAVEIPLRSFSSTAFPQLSQSVGRGRRVFMALMRKYTWYTTLLMVPVVVILVLFADSLLLFVGGERYLDSLEIQRKILYLISIYILLLPSDRYTGVALFALNCPKHNFYKTTMMLVANVLFNCVAVFVFHSLVGVALGTVFFTMLGVYWGVFFVKRALNNPELIVDR